MSSPTPPPMHPTQRFTLAALLLTLPVSFSLSMAHVLLSTPAVLAQTVNALQTAADRLNQQGIEQAQRGDAAAIQSFQQAAALYHRLNDRLREQAAWGNLGIVYSNQGDYTKAIEYHTKALQLARAIPYPKGEGAELGNLGTIYYALGKYAEAIEAHQKALKIAQTIKDDKGAAADLANLGNAYYALANYDQARDYYQQSLPIKQKIGDRRGAGRTLDALALVYYQKGDYDQATQYLRQALAIGQELQDPQILGAALRDLGRVAFDQGDYKQAIADQQQVLDIARQTQDVLSQGIALSNLGAAFFKTGQLAQAENALRDSIQRWESLRAGLGNQSANADKVSIFETQAGTYPLLQQVLVAAGKSNAALEIAERGRARAFVELLAGNLSRNSSSNRAESSPVAPPTLSQMQQIAQATQATLVEYSIINTRRNANESECYIWVVKPTGEITFRQADLKSLVQQQNTSLTQLVVTSRQAIGVRGGGEADIEVIASIDPTTQTNRLQQLHKLLIAPIADLLPKDPSSRVIFIPQGALFLVPFPALQAANGQYLIEQHTILTAPSIQALDLTRQQKQKLPASGNALVLGNPTMPTLNFPGQPAQQLADLPGARQEAIAIAPLLNTQPILGQQGTKAAIVQQMPNAHIIHLATHGLLDDVRGVESAIALAPDPAQPPKDALGLTNGLLTAGEILSLKLKADLVVLSACDTGRGRITGDGVIGLSRSFISAGVPSVIVSLWSIPDAPTAGLMTEFYTNWQLKKLDKAQALRQAMLTTRKTHPNPRDWAAFTLIGAAK